MIDQRQITLLVWQYKYTTKKLYVQPKTIRQHLELLPEPYRGQALQLMWWEDANNLYYNKYKALYLAFNWSRSPQGYNYWRRVHDEII